MTGSNPWQFCNFDDLTVGFPRDCGPVSSVGGQWNSVPRGLRSVAFYIDAAPPETSGIAEVRVSSDNSAPQMLTWSFASGTPEPAVFDGDLDTVIGDWNGGEGVMHDEVLAMRLQTTCPTSAFAVYGRDRDVVETDLRHVRVAYSMDGSSWTCFTQGACCGLETPQTTCSEGSIHASSGTVFTVPFPANFVEFAFWGQTLITEVQLVCCGDSCHAPVAVAPPPPPPLDGSGSQTAADAGTWELGLSAGVYGSTDVGEQRFNELFQRSTTHIIKRLCLDCAETHQIVYYKRQTQLDSFGPCESTDGFSSVAFFHHECAVVGC